jgi:cysteine synthase B
MNSLRERLIHDLQLAGYAPRTLFVGHSSGANVAAALRVARSLSEREQPGVVVTVLCDRGDRYFAPLEWEKHYVW